jgi:hypothetical protein
VLTLEVVRVGNEVLASTRAVVLAERSTSPVAAESGVDNELVVLEVLRDIARVVAREVGSGGTPRGGVGVAVGDILRNLATGEEPNHDALAIPLVRKDTATLLVEGVAEAVAAVLGYGTTSIVAVRAGTGRALEMSGHGIDGARNGARGTGVESDLVVSIQVDTLWTNV